MEKKHVPFRTKMRGGPSFFGLFTQLSGLLLKVNEWFLPPWKLACTPSWMSPQNASSESSLSKHEELLRPSPESTRTLTHKSFWVCVSLFHSFNLNFSPPPPYLCWTGSAPISEVEETHFPLFFNDFFSQMSRSGLYSYHTFSPLGGTLSRRKFPFTFHMFYSNGFGFNFFH